MKRKRKKKFNWRIHIHLSLFILSSPYRSTSSNIFEIIYIWTRDKKGERARINRLIILSRARKQRVSHWSWNRRKKAKQLTKTTITTTKKKKREMKYIWMKDNYSKYMNIEIEKVRARTKKDDFDYIQKTNDVYVVDN
jgi:hypothetical protein